MSSGLRRISRAAFRRARSSWLKTVSTLRKWASWLLVAEPDFFAVRQEDERHVEQIGVAAALRLARAQIDAGALGLQHGERAALPVEQRVVGPPAVIERVLEAHAVAISQLPVGVFQKLVDLDPGEGFIRHAVSASRGPLLMSP